jgi:hypothetical protein
MLLLGQILISLQKQQVLDQATAVGNDCYLSHTPSQVLILTGDQAIPRSDPNWDSKDRTDDWHQSHFIYCIIEGLRRAKVKPLNYSQVTAAQKGNSEPSVAFL